MNWLYDCLDCVTYLVVDFVILWRDDIETEHMATATMAGSVGSMLHDSFLETRRSEIVQHSTTAERGIDRVISSNQRGR